MKKLLITLAKVSISLAILAYLFWDIAQTKKGGQNIFVKMIEEPKDWRMLSAAFLVAGIALLFTFFRWMYLVRALGIPFSMRDTLRIGFLGFLFNLAPMGIVGGDLLKAVMLGQHSRGQRAKAFASVVVDRIIGLYVLFVVASVAILLTGSIHTSDRQLRFIFQVVLWITAGTTVGFTVLLLPGGEGVWLLHKVGRIPRIGKDIARLIEALLMYRRNLAVLALSCVLSVAVHCTFTLSTYLIARGLPGDVLSLQTQFVVYPVSAVAGTIPLPAGPFEASLEYFYRNVHAGGTRIAEGQGFIVALVYRLITLLIAAIGLCYYLADRREVSQWMHEAETDLDEPLSPTSAAVGPDCRAG